jgi:CrcB protein
VLDFGLAIAVAIAGGIGSVIRLFLGSWRGRLPWGIMVANSLAGLILAVLQLVSLRLDGVPAQHFVFSVVFLGLCGGLSTYSSVAADTGNYLRERSYGRAAANLAVNLGFPLVAYIVPVMLLINLVN